MNAADTPQRLSDNTLMVTPYADWPTLKYPGVAAFCIPPDATHELIDDGRTICVSFDETEMLVGLFPLTQSTVVPLFAMNDRE